MTLTQSVPAVLLFSAIVFCSPSAWPEKSAIGFKSDPLTLPAVVKTDIQILKPALYRAIDQREAKRLSSGIWYDLYYDKKAKTWHYDKARLTAVKKLDECSGQSATEVKSARDSLLLIKGLAAQTHGVTSMPLSKKHVWPDETYRFTFGGKSYVLRGKGVTLSRDRTEEGRWDNVGNYRLTLTDVSSGREQLLIAQPSFNDTFVAILFIGDLDGDDRPDFVFDTSPEYEIDRVVLFLSSRTDSSEIVRAVAEVSYDFSC